MEQTINPLPAQQPSLLELEHYLEGEVILPGSSKYEEARLAWNRSIDQHPALIVVAKSAKDIQTAVRYARRHQLGVAVQATGHGLRRLADEAMLILTNHMTGLTVDPITRTARVEAGVEWGPVLMTAQEHGLAPLLGSSPNVGAVGYTLGGGFGWLGRKYGLSSDNVLSFEVVTADGRLLTVSETENSDLFWGLRGGGGALAIVTAMTIRLFPVSHVYAGNLFYPPYMAHEVFRRYRDWIADAPEELTSSVLTFNFPPVDVIPEPLRGQSFAIVRGCFIGSGEQGEALLRYWRDWQTPIIDDFKTISFADAATISNDPQDPLPGFGSGTWLRELDDHTIDTFINYTLAMVDPMNPAPPPFVFGEIRHAGGAIKRIDPNAAVYGNRDAELLVNVIGLTPTVEAQRRLAAYNREFMTALRPAQTGGVYLNFLDIEESTDRLRDGLAIGGYEKLARLKAKYDPENLFRFGFQVTPAK